MLVLMNNISSDYAGESLVREQVWQIVPIELHGISATAPATAAAFTGL
jgi:DUF917 family protein